MGAEPRLHYIVEPQDLLAHRLHITLEVSGLEKGHGPLEFVLPVWSPGSYDISNYPRFLREVVAKSPSGESFPIVKTAKNRWKVTAGDADRVDLSYTVYGHGDPVRGPGISDKGVDITGEHIHFNPALTMCYLEGTLALPLDITVHPPSGWKVYTELAEAGKNPPRFRAKDYDELVDSPFELGNPLELSITPAGIPHRILFCGPVADVPEHQVQEDLTKIVEGTRKVFGTLPLHHYTFFFHLAERWDGGLEHATSTHIVAPHHIFRPRRSYEEFLSVIAHEYFHLFNVKRIRPKVLGPFDYDRENYTRMLWAMEGTTDYYCDLILRRTGLITPKSYFELIGKKIKKLRDGPGRLVQSLEEASFDSWIDYYKWDEDTRNSSVDYYVKGSLVSLCLDLEIRKRSGRTRDLDDVLRHLWNAYGARGIGLEEGSLEAEFERAAGVGLADLFRDYVRGRVEVDFEKHLGLAGLELVSEEKPVEKKEDDSKPAGWLGIECENVDGLPRARMVLDGSPAQRAGLAPGDLLVAVGGQRLTLPTLPEVLQRFEPGETQTVTFFRNGRLTSLEATLGKAPPEKWTLRPKANPTEEEKKILESWLGCGWEVLSK